MNRQADPRRRELARIHILAGLLGLDRDQYEAMLWSVGRVESSARLDSKGRAQVIAHLEAHAKTRGLSLRAKPRQRPADGKARLVAKVRALLINATPRRNDAYADGMSKRMFGIEKYTWCDPGQLHKLIAALQIDRTRREERTQ